METKESMKNYNISNEKKLRTVIREAIKIKLQHDEKINLLEENKLRKIIRHFIFEAKEIDADKNPTPYASTALDTLATAFNEILKTVKDGLRGLKRPEERLSYRMNMLYLFKRSFKRFEGFDAPEGDGVVGESDIMEQEEESVKVTLDLDDSARVMPADESENERFAPKEKSEEEKAKEEFAQERVGGTDETGAIRAFSTWNNSNIEQTLSDSRQLLPRLEDKQEFKEYCLYNIDLWMLTYEKEISQETGQEPAFTETIMPRPTGAEVQPQAAEFEGGADEALGGVGDEEDVVIPTFQ
jgi:hypothetical protein